MRDIGGFGGVELAACLGVGGAVLADNSSATACDSASWTPRERWPEEGSSTVSLNLCFRFKFGKKAESAESLAPVY